MGITISIAMHSNATWIHNTIFSISKTHDRLFYKLQFQILWLLKSLLKSFEVIKKWTDVWSELASVKHPIIIYYLSLAWNTGHKYRCTRDRCLTCVSLALHVFSTVVIAVYVCKEGHNYGTLNFALFMWLLQ